MTQLYTANFQYRWKSDSSNASSGRYSCMVVSRGLSQQRWPGTSRPQKCGSIVECSVSRIQHMKPTYRCFNEWDKNASSSGPSKRDKQVLPATSYGKANLRIWSSPVKSKEEGKRWTKASFPQSSDGKHRTSIPENHMGRHKKSNFENKNIMSRQGSYRPRHWRERYRITRYHV